jgi:hypothetical protein
VIESLKRKISFKNHWKTIAGFAILLAALILAVHMVLANISPEYLKNGRTYDQETTYIKWNGSVGFVSVTHADNTSLPPSEGGAPCNPCTETVTRIYSGSSISGNFTYLQTFNIQAETNGDPATGTMTVSACGQVIATKNLYIAGAGLPGYNNYPSPAWSVPTAGDCTWSISASGGYVDVRAVTTTYRATAAPAVDLRVNASNGPLYLGAPASYTLSWTSTNAAACSASGSWSGAQATNSSQAYASVAAGTYTYTLTCTNPNGSASDSVMVYVLPPPTVSITAPASLTAPASYTASWTSTNATSCTGSNRFSSLSGLSGSLNETSLPAGAYDYTVTCQNAAGVQANTTVRTTVYAVATVDVKVDGSDGPILYRTGPYSYSATWTSSNAASCSGSSRLAGYTGLSGTRAESNIPAGMTYDYTVTCQNAIGTAVSDTVRIVVVATPTVDVKVDGSDGPTLTRTGPSSYIASWTSANATSCSGSSRLAGYSGTSGSRAETSIPAGTTYDYTMTCQNAAGTSASDTVRMVVVAAPTVDVKVDGLDGPTLTRTGPYSYTASWASSNATACNGSARLAGYTGLSGSRGETNVAVGTTYDYTVTCQNAAGTTASDTVRMVVVAAPTVDVKVDGLDGPTLTRTGPYSYSASWSSTNAASCSGASRLAGYTGLSGMRSETTVAAGTTYDYTVTCQNAAGTSVSDTVRMVIVAAPTVDVKVNSLDGPLTFTEPAGFTVTWTSTNTTSCAALDNLSGPVGLSGSSLFSSVLQGTYRYTVQCINAAGTTISDSVTVTVLPQPPVVDLKVDSSDGPVTRVSPASYTLSWTSQYAVSCSANSSDGSWTGSAALIGTRAFNSVSTGIRTYTLSCTNVSGTVTDTVSVTVLAPLTGTLSPLYARLLLFAPNLGQPAQTLTGTVSGGEAPYSLVIHVRAPSGLETTFTRSGSAWSLTPASAGNPNFGTTEEGTWTAWADITDVAGRSYRTVSATWEVSWYPVHGRP